MNKYTNNLSIILLVSLSQSAFAQVDSTVYKWIDAKKQINYTDRPAPGRTKTENIENKIRNAAGLPTKKIRTGYSYTPSKTKASSSDKSIQKTSKSTHTGTEISHQTIADDYAKKLKNYCKQQSSNLTTLLGDTPIAWEEDGKTILLSADQRKEKIKTLKSSLAKKCSTKPQS